jgi:hypothetical protein
VEWIPAPIEDLREFTARTVRKVLMDLPEFRTSMPGFQKAFPSGTLVKELQFPVVGVDFRTVTLTGHSGAFTPQVLTPDGLVARVAFDADQQGRTVTVDPYTSWTTYMVAVVDEVPFDLFTWYGDPDAKDKQKRTIPLLVPIVEDWQVNRYAGRGETANVVGTLLLYGTATPDSQRILKVESAKVYNAVRANGDKFTMAGIKSFLVDPPTYSFCRPEEGNGVLMEAQMRFSGLVKLH